MQLKNCSGAVGYICNALSSTGTDIKETAANHQLLVTTRPGLTSPRHSSPTADWPSITSYIRRSSKSELKIIFIQKLIIYCWLWSWWWRCQFLNILSDNALYFLESQWFGKWNIRETNQVDSLVLIGLELTRQFPTFLFLSFSKMIIWEYDPLSLCWTYFPQISFIYLPSNATTKWRGLMETNDPREGKLTVS